MSQKVVTQVMACLTFKGGGTYTCIPVGSVGRNGQMPILIGMFCALNSIAGLTSHGLPFWLMKSTEKEAQLNLKAVHVL